MTLQPPPPPIPPVNWVSVNEESYYDRDLRTELKGVPVADFSRMALNFFSLLTNACDLSLYASETIRMIIFRVSSNKPLLSSWYDNFMVSN